MKENRDNIYIYVWEEFNTIYIGRTVNPKGRHYQHKHRETEPTYKFSSEHHVEHPNMIIIENDLSLEKGIEREKYWISYYREESSYNVLNKSCGGQVGGQLMPLALTEEEKRERNRLYKLEYNKTHKEERRLYNAAHKEQRKIYYNKNKEKLREKALEKYYKNHEENKEKSRENWKKYHINHVEEIKKKDRERYAANKNKKIEYQKEYRRTHREELLAKKKLYREKHKEELRLKAKEYREKMKNQ